MIALLSPSGGSGSSTLAASISTVLAQEHGDCGLIDLRLGVGDLAPMFDLRPVRTLADLCDHVTRLDQSLFEQFLVRHASGVWLLAAPSQSGRPEPRDVQRRAAGAGAGPRPVFPRRGRHGEHLDRRTDRGLVAGRLDPAGLEAGLHVGPKHAADDRRDDRIGDRPRPDAAGGQRMGQRRQLEVEQAEAAVGMKVHHQVPYDAASVHSAINSGVPVVLHRRFRRITRSIKTLAHSVNGVVQ